MLMGMSRTNIDIDDQLIAKVMEVYDLTTKREAVDFALRQLVPKPMTREQMLALRGSGWGGNLNEPPWAEDPIEEW
jgi:Arc/MetJ family transcription regulator